MTGPHPLAIRYRLGRPFTKRPVLPRLSPAGDRIAWLVTDGDPRVGTAGAWYARVDRVDPVRVLENLEITDLAWSRTERSFPGRRRGSWPTGAASSSRSPILPTALWGWLSRTRTDRGVVAGSGAATAATCESYSPSDTA